MSRHPPPPARGAPGAGYESGLAARGVSNSAADTVHVRLCGATFLLANPRCPGVVEVDLEPQLVPKGVCTKH
jgi:hypothetical protein